MHTHSVILPVFNESETILKTLSAVILFSQQNPEYCFFFVNDGSKDDTAARIKSAIQTSPSIFLVDNRVNLGKAGAIELGLQKVKTPFVIFTDGDLAYSLDHLHLVSTALQANDVVIGNRNLSENHLRNVRRVIAGEAFNRAVRVLLRMPITDTQAGIKGFRKEAADLLFRMHRIRDFAFDAELLYIAKHKGLRIGQVPAKVNEDHQFHSSTVRIVSDSPRMFFSLLKIIYFRFQGYYNE
jgi:dolichyl-phosphate beta-glucosyltransferase